MSTQSTIKMTTGEKLDTPTKDGIDSQGSITITGQWRQQAAGERTGTHNGKQVESSGLGKAEDGFAESGCIEKRDLHP